MTLAKEDPRAFEKGTGFMLISATCLSLSLLFLKINLGSLNYFLLIFLRFLIPLAVVTSFVLAFWQWKTLFFVPRLGLQVSRCGCILVAQYCMAYYLMQRSLLNATVLFNAGPLFIPFLERFFLKRPIGKSTLVGALISLFGVLLILQPDKSLFTPISAIGILGAFAQAGSQVLYGLRSRENLTTGLFYLFFFGSLFSGGIYLIVAQTSWGINPENVIPYSLLVSSLIFMGLSAIGNQYFRGIAYRYSTPSRLATFLYFSVFISGMLDWVIFRRIPTLLTLIGSALIILGGVLKIYLRSKIIKRKNK